MWLRNMLASLFFWVCFLALLAGVLRWGYYHPYFAITELQVQAEKGNLQHTTPSQIRAVLPTERLGNFFSFPLQQLESQLLTLPWVRQVSITRHWPNALRLQVQEHEAVAKWNDEWLLNTYDEAFRAEQQDLSSEQWFAHYWAPMGTERWVSERVRRLNAWLALIDQRITQVQVGDRYDWVLHLERGVTMQFLSQMPPDLEADAPSGVPDMENKLRYFVRAWPALQQQYPMQRLKKVDFRYTDYDFVLQFLPEDNKGAQYE